MPFHVLLDGSVRCDTIAEVQAVLDVLRYPTINKPPRGSHEPGCIYAESGHPGECVMRGDIYPGGDKRP